MHDIVTFSVAASRWTICFFLKIFFLGDISINICKIIWNRRQDITPFLSRGDAPPGFKTSISRCLSYNHFHWDNGNQRNKPISSHVTFKSVKGLNPDYMSSLFAFSTTPYCTRGGSKLVQPKVNTISFGINSFAYQGSKIWNNLPRDVKDANCSITCMDLIVRWQGPTCQCGFCVMYNMSKI